MSTSYPHALTWPLQPMNLHMDKKPATQSNRPMHHTLRGLQHILQPQPQRKLPLRAHPPRHTPRLSWLRRLQPCRTGRIQLQHMMLTSPRTHSQITSPLLRLRKPRLLQAMTLINPRTLPLHLHLLHSRPIRMEPLPTQPRTLLLPSLFLHPRRQFPPPLLLRPQRSLLHSIAPRPLTRLTLPYPRRRPGMPQDPRDKPHTAHSLPFRLRRVPH